MSMQGEITRKSVLLECLSIMREELRICSKGYNCLEPAKGMEEAWEQGRRKVQILQHMIQAYESEPVRKALADWQKDVMENGPSALEISREDIIDALDSVTWYNCLAEIILEWKNDSYFDKYENYCLSWNWETFKGYDADTQYQLQVIWMICVELFGECGTSPRSGWILMQNRREFNKFIDDITKTYRESTKEQN